MSDIRIGHWTKLGASIRDARRDQKLSQGELAERAGVSRSWLAKVEAGHRGAEFEQILLVLSALGLTLTLRAAQPTQAPTSAPKAPKARKRKAAASKSSSATSSTAKSKGMSTATRLRVADSMIPAAAASRLIERHAAALGSRRASWGPPSLKRSEVEGG